MQIDDWPLRTSERFGKPGSRRIIDPGVESQEIPFHVAFRGGLKSLLAKGALFGGRVCNALWASAVCSPESSFLAANGGNRGDKNETNKIMQRKQSLTSFIKVAACAIAALSMVSAAQAADGDKKASPTGTWSWSTPGRDGGEPRKSTLTLKADGEKLTGKVSAPGRQGGEPRETEISDGKVKGDDVSFNVVREFQGNKMTQKFAGKLAGDSIKGKIAFERNGEEQSRDWEAKREANKK